MPDSLPNKPASNQFTISGPFSAVNPPNSATPSSLPPQIPKTPQTPQPPLPPNEPPYELEPPPRQPPEPSKRPFFANKTWLGFFTVIFLLTAIAATAYLAQQRQEIRERAEPADDLCLDQFCDSDADCCPSYPVCRSGGPFDPAKRCKAGTATTVPSPTPTPVPPQATPTPSIPPGYSCREDGNSVYVTNNSGQDRQFACVKYACAWPGNPPGRCDEDAQPDWNQIVAQGSESPACTTNGAADCQVTQADIRVNPGAADESTVCYIIDKRGSDQICFVPTNTPTPTSTPSPTPTATPTATATPTPSLTLTPTPTPELLVCRQIKAYLVDESKINLPSGWTPLTSDELHRQLPGTTIYFSVAVDTALISRVDKASFQFIEGGTPLSWQETTSKNPFGEYYVSHNLPGGGASFSVKAVLHDTLDDSWH